LPVILNQVALIQLDTPLKTSPDAIATPYTLKAMRQFNRKYAKNPGKKA